MKKMFLLMFSIFCLVSVSDAQNIEPGGDAQGYLNGKNILVDYCTGIFHYTVPLFNVSSGNFTLPLSLNYSSREYMQNIPNGIVGKNWSLQVGGIVTRIVRGGIADEEKNKGYIFQLPQEQLTDEFIASANNHVKDGESDMFSASFGSNSVNFIIKKEGNSVVAVPLERTNVKISCEYDSSTSNIRGWIVIDENGVRYIYRVQEWTKNLNRSTDVMTNNLKDKAYVSSWYLSSIEIPNASTIQYTYETELDLEGRSVNKYLDFSCVNHQYTVFHYGGNMYSFKFDLSGQRKQLFDEYLRMAEKEISFINFIQSHPNLFPPTEFNYAFSSMESSWVSLLETRSSVGTVLGTVSVFPGGSFPTVKVMATLNEMMRYYRYTMAYNYLSLATNCFVDAIRDELIDSSQFSTMYSYSVSTPLLKKISTDKEEVVFNYGNLLNEIVLRDYRGIQKQKIKLNIYRNNLNEVFWYGSDDLFFQRQQFDYSEGILTGVFLPSGGNIRVEYESNICDTEVVRGKRVKAIILDDKLCTCDTINYRYPYPGYLVYDQISYKDTIIYGHNFSDRVNKNTPICKGVVYQNQGNNGIVYHYVEEELRGKGVNTYLFSIPASSGNSSDRSYSFWLCGLPLGKAVYNAAGQLVLLQKCKYYTDLVHSNFCFGREWFETCPENFNYNQNQWQVELCEYYMGGSELRQYYSNQPKTLLYQDINYRNVYLDPMVKYNQNVVPRLSIQSPRQGYKMYYGGKTVLKTQKEYMFPNNTGQSPSIEHLTGELPSGAVLMSDIEYRYDNPILNVSPTRVIHTKANGDQLINIKRTSLDISTSDITVKNMQDLNLVAPVIKEQVLLLKNGADHYLLLEENVKHFQEVGSAIGKVIFLPEKISHFIGSAPVEVDSSVLALECNGITTNANKYREELYTYQIGNGRVLLENLVSFGGTSAVCYDRGNNQMIMEAENCERVYIDAVDRYRVLFNSAGNIRDEKVAGNTLLNYLKVRTDVSTRRFVVTLLVKPTSSKLSLAYSVMDNTEKSYNTEEKPVTVGKWQIVQFDIHITSGTFLKVNFPMGQLAIGTIAPQGITYNAYSYDPEGRLFGEYDQNGLVERYEYDSAGRLFKVYDRGGYILREYNYKTL